MKLKKKKMSYEDRVAELRVRAEEMRTRMREAREKGRRYGMVWRGGELVMPEEARRIDDLRREVAGAVGGGVVAWRRGKVVRGEGAPVLARVNEAPGAGAAESPLDLRRLLEERRVAKG